MHTLNIITLVLWFIIGLANLIDKAPITKFSYGMVWFVLILEILMNLLH